ncbi:hypothetical protein L6164_028716 [Bauhinia variegata]|uniref:Uncharacterized protein n=1 Tax=Bauhinia variegata TaxID=167791 RepID=A0ACB9L750_BAUVA|nr:hypothetical protein L6164_028716 [Bauhinia variegata]
MRAAIVSEISLVKRLPRRLNRSLFFSSETLQVDPDDPLYSDVPKPRWKKTREEASFNLFGVLKCKSNKLYWLLLVGFSFDCFIIFGFCNEVHIGHFGHEIRTCTGPNSGFRSAMHVWRRGGVQDVIFFPKCFHLYDRVGKPRVGHDERRIVRRIPAIVELCIQAGLDLKKYPTKRRTKPVYCIEGRIVDFESVIEDDEAKRNFFCESNDSLIKPSHIWIKPIKKTKNLVRENQCKYLDQLSDEVRNKLGDLSRRTLASWFEMISGAKKIMEKYTVNGYCPEVQVGPEGHKVRMCKASKHQQRDGLHAWQQATIDDLVGPNYVWHVWDLKGPALSNNLKRYYGKAPAVVELCVHAGALIPDQYRSMMRLDVVPPGRDEADLVA